MKQILALLAAGVMIPLGCGRPPPPEAPMQSAQSTLEQEADIAREPDQKLPYAKGREFETLDSYLAWREELGHRDLPWYLKREDGRYELVAGRRPPGYQPEVFTREELMEKYGFSR